MSVLLSKTVYSKEYLSLYDLKIEGHPDIQLNNAYAKYWNNGSYQIVVFYNDSY